MHIITQNMCSRCCRYCALWCPVTEAQITCWINSNEKQLVLSTANNVLVLTELFKLKLIYAFGRCFYLKHLELHSRYTFFSVYVFPENQSLDIGVSSVWATGMSIPVNQVIVRKNYPTNIFHNMISNKASCLIYTFSFRGRYLFIY